MGMSTVTEYKLIGIDETFCSDGNAIVTIWCEPSWWSSLMGITPECVAFVGRNDRWKCLDGGHVSYRERKILSQFWHDNHNSSPSTFQQSCGTCGCPTIIRRDQSGDSVGCRHCGGQFVAFDDSIIEDKTMSTQTVSIHRPREWREANAFLYRLAASFVAAIGNPFGEVI